MFSLRPKIRVIAFQHILENFLILWNKQVVFLPQNALFLDVVNLLAEIILDDYFVCIPYSFYSLNTLQHIVTHIGFAPASVEAIAGDSYYQVVSPFLCPPQEVEVPLV